MHPPLDEGNSLAHPLPLDLGSRGYGMHHAVHMLYVHCIKIRRNTLHITSTCYTLTLCARLLCQLPLFKMLPALKPHVSCPWEFWVIWISMATPEILLRPGPPPPRFCGRANTAPASTRRAHALVSCAALASSWQPLALSSTQFNNHNTSTYNIARTTGHGQIPEP